jgi:hypothetical protein
MAAVLVGGDYVSTGQCHLTLANIRYGWNSMFFGVPKSSPFKEEINREYVEVSDNRNI